MKKISIFFALLAGFAVMTGCKKDYDVVTLQAVIDQDQNTKAYFGTPVRPYWDSDDSVCIMAPGYSGKLICELSDVTETYAKIEGVQSSEGCYCAIYPVEAVYQIGTPQSDGTTQAVIYFDPHQEYIWDTTNNHQRVNMIMGAVTDNDSKTFHFKNLCSILRLKVTNNLPNNRTMNVRRLTVYGYGAYVAGCAEVTLTKSGEPVITVDQLGSDAENVLSVHKPDNTYMKTLAHGATDSFDVVVPPFSADGLNIELEMFDGTGKFIGNSDNDITPTAPNTKVTLTRNKIVTIELNVSTFETPDYAYLAQGPVFNNIIKSLIGNEDVVNITFNTSWDASALPPEGYTQEMLDTSSYAGWKVVSRADSPLKIFATIVVDTVSGAKQVEVLSHANYMYADANCIGMFQGLESLQTINIDQNDDGTGFQTEDVTDMSYMFAGCTHLTSIAGLTDLNLTNVTNMAHMFENCKSYINLTLNPLNTHNLIDTGLVATFKGCDMLGTININTFTTDHVTSMKELFKDTPVRWLYIGNLVISNGTDLTGAFIGVGWNANNPCNIYCTEAVETTLRQQGTSVIDLSRVTFHRPE